ncbi:MAG TPA: rhodanese-like domain-containing protein [Chthonomonadaceae bacterium]|nr:rhodanese-like domain-containing protein [Chthonomonadaceae bacterium]
MDETSFKIVTAEEVQTRQQANPDLLLLDVRTPEEWEEHHIPSATLLPMDTLIDRLEELDPERETIVLCEHGLRSQSVAHYLVTQAGFRDVASMEGGMSEWTGPVIRGA